MLQVEPQNIEALSGLASGYFQLKEYEEAILYYQKVAELDPDNAWAHFGVGWCYISLKDCENATPWLEAGLKLEPGNEDARGALERCREER